MLKNLQNKLNENKGFTLVELIVVIAIMVILIALLVPNVIGYISQAQDTANLSSAKAIYNAANTAVVNHKASTGNYPDAAALANLMNGKGSDGTETDAAKIAENKLVTVSSGTSAAIAYDTGAVKQVWVCTATSATTDVTGADTDKNLACYDPQISGNAAKSDSAPTFASAIKCTNGGEWSAS